MMRPRRQPLHPAPQILPIELRIELRLQRMLPRRIVEPEDRLGCGLGEGGGGEEEGEDERPAHGRGFYACGD
jgi:hypothetical protein